MISDYQQTNDNQDDKQINSYVEAQNQKNNLLKNVFTKTREADVFISNKPAVEEKKEKSSAKK